MEIEKSDINTNYFISNLKKELYSSSKFIISDNAIAKYIHENINLIKSEPDVMLHIYKKIISANHIIKNIVEYDFINYIPEKKINDIDMLIKLAIVDIYKFQNVIGGFDIEDNDWIISTETSIKRFNLNNNQKVIYNTLEQRNKNEQNNNFIKMYVNYLKRHIDLDARINIYHNLIDDDKNEICWVVIIFEKLIDYLD